MHRQRKGFIVADDGDLREVIAKVQGRTLASKLRQLMPAIDEKVREGVGHEDLIEALNAQGFSLNLNTFRSNLYRWRKAQSGVVASKPVAPVAPVKVPAQSKEPVASPIPSDGNSGGRAQAARFENKGDMKRARQTNYDLDELAAAADNEDKD